MTQFHEKVIERPFVVINGTCTGPVIAGENNQLLGFGVAVGVIDSKTNTPRILETYSVGIMQFALFSLLGHPGQFSIDKWKTTWNEFGWDNNTFDILAGKFEQDVSFDSITARYWRGETLDANELPGRMAHLNTLFLLSHNHQIFLSRSFAAEWLNDFLMRVKAASPTGDFTFVSDPVRCNDHWLISDLLSENGFHPITRSISIASHRHEDIVGSPGWELRDKLNAEAMANAPEDLALYHHRWEAHVTLYRFMLGFLSIKSK